MSITTEIKSLRKPTSTEILIPLVLSIATAFCAYYLDGARAFATGFAPCYLFMTIAEKAGVRFRTPILLFFVSIIAAVIFLAGGYIGITYLPPHK